MSHKAKTPSGKLGANTEMGAGSAVSHLYPTTPHKRGKGFPVHAGRNVGAYYFPAIKLCRKVAKPGHEVEKPRGWALDDGVLQEVVRLGAELIEVYEEAKEVSYFATVAHFLQYCTPIDRGFGSQRLLCRRYWDFAGKDEEASETTDLPEQMLLLEAGAA